MTVSGPRLGCNLPLPLLPSTRDQFPLAAEFDILPDYSAGVDLCFSGRMVVPFGARHGRRVNHNERGGGGRVNLGEHSNGRL